MQNILLIAKNTGRRRQPVVQGIYDNAWLPESNPLFCVDSYEKKGGMGHIYVEWVAVNDI